MQKVTLSALCIYIATIAVSKDALAEDTSQIASFDGGNRIVVSYHWKIEHRAISPTDIFIHQIGTPEGRKILATLATALGIDPSTATIITEYIPLPKIDHAVTDNKGILAAPTGMTVCNAASGNLETSHASWSATILRRSGLDGLGYYTSVGTSPGTTHRIQGDFAVEYVKPVDGWQAKYNCLPDGKVVWDQHG